MPAETDAEERPRLRCRIKLEGITTHQWLSVVDKIRIKPDPQRHAEKTNAR